MTDSTHPGNAAIEPVTLGDPMVADAAQRLFAGLVPDAVAAAARGEPPDELLQAVEEAGFADALPSLDSRDGWPLAAAILRAQGRHAAPIDMADELLGRAVSAEPDGSGMPDLGGASEARRVRAAALMRCLQISGAMEAALALSVGYVSERRQFGRPLSSFQAIQHSLALAAEDAAAATVATDLALAAVCRDGIDSDRFGALLDAAVIVSGDAVPRIYDVVHQVHGAIGFTREYALQRFTLSMLRWRDELGGEQAPAERLGARVMAVGGLWSTATALSGQAQPDG
jgi:acyl-CoA dehydrogenase